MNRNWPLGYRGSMQDYSNEFYNSTPYAGGSNGRSASTGHVQYPQFSSQSHLTPGLGDHRMSNQFQYGQLESWNNDSGLSQRPSQLQAIPTNNVDPGELSHFSRPADDEPWNPPAVRSAHENRQQQHPQWWPSTGQVPKAHTVAAGSVSPSFQQPRPYPPRTSVPSRDSGFESPDASSQHLSKPSRSVYELSSGRSWAFAPNAVPPPRSVKSESRLQTTEESTRRRKVKAAVPPCLVCGRELKNQSDARKHQLQHDKPYSCEVPTCGRRLGFATKNDLQRHRKSVHGARPLVGKETGYICQACPTVSPGSREKWWPRLDNFKAHIERKHKEWDMARLIGMSEAARPENAVSESGYASQAPHSVAAEDQGYQHDLMSPLDIPMSRRGSQQGDLTLFGLDHGQFDPLVGVGGGPLTDPFANRGSIPRQHGPTSGSISNGLSVLHDAALQLDSPVDSIMTSPVAHRGSVPSIHINQFSFSDARPFNPVHWGPPPQKRAKPDWTSKQALFTDQDNLNANRTDSGDYACHHCEKIKKRECDLRKHIKRHTRPYGCTFPNCYKRFGSRNDWKRHENSQHFLQEMWRCGLNTVNGTTCGKLIYHEETFINHLRRRHGLDDKSLNIQSYTKTMHLGREGHHHFWCGFCNMLIAQEDGKQQDSMQQSAWAMRFNHIGNHFDKNNDHIDSWVCIEHNKKKGLITKEDRKKAKTRPRNGKADDGSDLGDDGIPSSLGFAYPKPISHAPVGRDPDISAAGNMGTSNKRRRDDADSDADAVSDSGY